MFSTIQIDLTKIGALMRENANLTKKVQFKDGIHQLLNISIGDRREPDQFGNNLIVSCKPKEEAKDNKWYIGQGKTWADNNTSTPSPSTPDVQTTDTSIPF